MKKKNTEDLFYIGISDEAKIMFDSILESHDKINPKLHFAILANFCEACVRLKKLYETSKKMDLWVESKNGETYVHPIQKLIKDERDEICRGASKLGLDINTIDNVAMGRKLKGFKSRLMSKVVADK